MDMKLSEEQIEARNRARRKKKAKRRRVTSLFLVFVAGVLIISSVVLALGALAFSAYLYLPSVSLPYKYSVNVGRRDPKSDKLKDVKKFTLSPGEMTRNGEEYLDFSMLAERCGFSVSGDSRTLKYIIETDHGSDRLVVDFDSSSVVVNGTAVSLRNGAFMRDGHLYLPGEFISFYVNGITVEKGSGKHEIKVTLDDSFSLRIRRDGSTDRVDISDI